MPDLDPRWPGLLTAARAWKAGLIPNTSTSILGPARALVAAIEAFDVCDHPRLAWVFHGDGSIECSTCTTILKPVAPTGPGP